MKKIITSILLITLFIISYSQTPIGFTVGSNFSYLTIDSSRTAPMKYGKPGTFGGLFWDVPTGYKAFVEVGFFYSLQGAQFKSIKFSYNQHTLISQKETYIKNYNIHYIKMPILWKQSWGDWYTKLGVYGEIAAYKTAKWNIYTEPIDTITPSEGHENSFVDNLRAFDIGLNLSMGVQFNITPRLDFFLNAQYNMGFLNLTPQEMISGNKMYNRFFTLSTGIIFNKSKYKYRK